MDRPIDQSACIVFDSSYKRYYQFIVLPLSRVTEHYVFQVIIIIIYLFFFKKWELEWILIVKNKCNMCILACKCTYCTRLGFLVSYAFRFLIRKVQKFKQNLGYHYEEVFLHRENCSFSSWKCFSDGHWTTSILENKIEYH